ncbi:hypothetical protein GCM10010400_03440 [Streptomyces aculeolatus]
MPTGAPRYVRRRRPETYERDEAVGFPSSERGFDSRRPLQTEGTGTLGVSSAEARGRSLGFDSPCALPRTRFGRVGLEVRCSDPRENNVRESNCRRYAKGEHYEQNAKFS